MVATIDRSPAMSFHVAGANLASSVKILEQRLQGVVALPVLVCDL